MGIRRIGESRRLGKRLGERLGKRLGERQGRGYLILSVWDGQANGEEWGSSRIQ
jgi:hypothetical protein